MKKGETGKVLYRNCGFEMVGTRQARN